MTNFTTPQGQTSKDLPGKSGTAGAGGYKSKLDEILAKAGTNNPIAAAQAKNLGKTQQQAPAPSQPQSPTPSQPLPQTTGMAPQPAPPAAQPPVPAPAAPVPTAPPASAPGAPQNPNDRLQQILAMAGQTPAQRAQTQAQQALANNAANIAQMLQNYLMAVSQDPRKILCCDIEFASNPGANTEVYFKCYADAAGNAYWDVFGEDIDYTVQGLKTTGYGLFDNYYRGVTDADFRADMATATVHSSQII